MTRFISVTTLLIALVLSLTANANQQAVVNINTAPEEELAEVLDGVGMSRAQAIVEYREAHGAFEDVYELINVQGIGERTVVLNESRIRLGDE